MAQPQQQTKQPSKGNKAPPPKAEAPKEAKADANTEPDGDWDDLGERPIDGWYRPEVGLVVTGKVVGRTKMQQDNGERHVILIELTQPAKAVVEGGTRKDPNFRELQPGEVIAVGLRHRIRDLIMCVKNNCMVWFRALEEKEIKNGRTVWEFKLKVKGKRARPDPIVQSLDDLMKNIDTPAGADGGDDDIPF